MRNRTVIRAFRRGFGPAVWMAALGLLASLALACGSDDDAPVASPLRTLTLTEWSEDLCALSAVAADTLDVAGPKNPETLTLEERKQRAADILAPRAASLTTTAEAVSALQAPGAAAAFQEVFESTMSDVAAGWQDLVDAAARAQSFGELDAANGAWLQVQDEADGSVIAAYRNLDDQTTAALVQPEDCGILNEIGS